ncbi:MAG: sulfur carrier protein ThiS adenylyltransferase ThiF [Solirubrobacterales bacterium]
MNIKLNGKPLASSCSTLYELREESFGDSNNIVTILNGFQTNDDYALKENDEVNFIQKGEMPPQDEFESLMCARHTPHVFEKAKAAKVAIAGLGGLGSNIAVSLARTGIGNLHLIDFDIVEPSNLNRQQYKIKHLGLYKTEALKNEIEEINPFIEVTIDTIKVTEENIKELFEKDEFICEAFDNPTAKAMLVNTLLETYPGKKIVSASGMAGFESSNTIITKKITSNFYLCGDMENGAKVGRGLMAPRVSICAGHQANMVLRLILGIEEI